MTVNARRGTEINIRIYALRNVRQMQDYGKHVRWPAPPLVLRSMVSDFQSIHNRWRAQMILSNVPKTEWPQLRIKVTYLCLSSSVLMKYKKLKSDLSCHLGYAWGNGILDYKYRPHLYVEAVLGKKVKH